MYLGLWLLIFTTLCCNSSVRTSLYFCILLFCLLICCIVEITVSFNIDTISYIESGRLLISSINFSILFKLLGFKLLFIVDWYFFEFELAQNMHIYLLQFIHSHYLHYRLCSFINLSPNFLFKKFSPLHSEHLFLASSKFFIS